MATAMNNTLQQVSGAISSALLVTVMSNSYGFNTLRKMMASEVRHMMVQPSVEALAELKRQIPH